MKEFRITKARTVEVIRRYRGKPDGIQAELKKGGIDISRPYTQTRDAKTGDYIYMQDAPKPKVIIKPPKAKEKAKKMPDSTSMFGGKKGKKGK